MIIVFRENLTIGALVDSAHGVVEIREESLRERLDEFSSAMAGGPAHLRLVGDEGNIHGVGYRDVGRDSPDYEEALVFELGVRGLFAMAIEAQYLALLDLLDTDRFTTEQRNQVISVLRNLPHDQVAEFVKAILDISALGASVRGGV